MDAPVKALNTEKAKALQAALAQIEKQFGKGSIMRLGQKGAIQPIEAIPTGAISIDYALGVGGVPRGRVTEIYGPESSGKTTLCQHIVAEAQRRGGVCGYVDMEHALDPVYAARCGVDVENLYIAQPDTGEQALEIAEALVVTEHTAKYHVASLLNKLGAASRAEAVTRAVALGLLTPSRD